MIIFAVTKPSVTRGFCHLLHLGKVLIGVILKKPNIFQIIISVCACKLSRFIIRLTKRGGTTLPGKIAMVFCKDILNVTSKNMDIIVVTGTNGKTTTCKMIEHAFEANGIQCLSNRSGANLLSGITAEITCNATLTGKAKSRYAVIECDEAALKQVTPRIRPKVILVTNLFRDQLDRYGEITNTLNEIRKGIEGSPDSIVCLNSDDSLVSSLSDSIPNKIVRYGFDTGVDGFTPSKLSDAKYCIKCGSEYKYRYHTYSHLGSFYCDKCGYERIEPQISVKRINELGVDSSVIDVDINGHDAEVNIGLPAVYNIYNAIGTIAAFEAFGFDYKKTLESLASVHSSFGRLEKFVVKCLSGDVNVRMILVKNPAGCDQALDYVGNVKEQFNLIFCLNDRTADGHDISWIWDSNYENTVLNENVNHIYVYGDRKEDMRLRLKYADVKISDISTLDSIEEFLDVIKNSNIPVFVLPNYTSMLETRKALSELTGKNEFWKQQ